jgi:hypothetical protein
MEVKDIYNEYYKPLKKEIKEDYRRWKDLKMLMDCQNQYWENSYIAKCNL